MKHLLLLSTLFMVLLSFGQIRTYVFDSATGDELFTHVNVNNLDNVKKKDVRLTVTVLDPVYEPKNELFDRIGTRSTASHLFFWDVPERTGQEVWVKFRITDDKGNEDSKYRSVII